MQQPIRESGTVTGGGGSGLTARSLVRHVAMLVLLAVGVSLMVGCAGGGASTEGADAARSEESSPGPAPPSGMRHEVTYFLGDGMYSAGADGMRKLFETSEQPQAVWPMRDGAAGAAEWFLYRVGSESDPTVDLRLTDATGRDDRVVVKDAMALVRICSEKTIAYRPSRTGSLGPETPPIPLAVKDVSTGEVTEYEAVVSSMLAEDGRRAALTVLGPRDPGTGEHATTVRLVETDGSVQDLLEVDSTHVARPHAIDEDALVFSVALHGGGTDGRVYLHDRSGGYGSVGLRTICGSATVHAADLDAGWICVERSGLDDGGTTRRRLGIRRLTDGETVSLITLGAVSSGEDALFAPTVADARPVSSGSRVWVAVSRLGDGDSLHLFDAVSGEELYSYVLPRGVAFGPGRIAVTDDGEGVLFPTQSGEPGAPGVEGEQLRYVDLASGTGSTVIEGDGGPDTDPMGAVSVRSCPPGG